MTKTEWLDRCAARYVDRGGMEPAEAMLAAVECFEAEGGDADFSTIAPYNPESVADDDMSSWSDGAAN